MIQLPRQMALYKLRDPFVLSFSLHSLSTIKESVQCLSFAGLFGKPEPDGNVHKLKAAHKFEVSFPIVKRCTSAKGKWTV